MNVSLLLKTVKEDRGKGLAHINPWKYPSRDPWKTIFFYDMWKGALENSSVDGFHTLALYTPIDCINGAIELAVHYHSSEALVPLLNKKYNNTYCLFSCAADCQECKRVFLQVKKWFPSLRFEPTHHPAESSLRANAKAS
jgi:hypothetical protein